MNVPGNTKLILHFLTAVDLAFFYVGFCRLKLCSWSQFDLHTRQLLCLSVQLHMLNTVHTLQQHRKLLYTTIQFWQNKYMLQNTRFKVSKVIIRATLSLQMNMSFNAHPCKVYVCKFIHTAKMPTSSTRYKVTQRPKYTSPQISYAIPRLKVSQDYMSFVKSPLSLNYFTAGISHKVSCQTKR